MRHRHHTASVHHAWQPTMQHCRIGFQSDSPRPSRPAPKFVVRVCLARKLRHAAHSLLFCPFLPLLAPFLPLTFAPDCGFSRLITTIQRLSMPANRPCSTFALHTAPAPASVFFGFVHFFAPHCPHNAQILCRDPSVTRTLHQAELRLIPTLNHTSSEIMHGLILKKTRPTIRNGLSRLTR